MVMDWQTLFFTTGGRINRANFIMAALAYASLSFLVLFSSAVLLTTNWRNMPIVLFIAYGLFAGLLYFSALTVTIKRLHDRDKVGWWAVPFVMLPGLLRGAAEDVAPPTGTVLQILGGLLLLWGFVELACLRGTSGTNRFGPDPLQADPRSKPGG
jgi:uncharacterized membrane protein YhaH (DUF805 family)